MDERLRQLERDALRDPGAQDRLVAERIRAGGRDPRHDPQPGDAIEAQRTAWGGGPPRLVRRSVVEVWPRAIAQPCRCWGRAHSRSGEPFNMRAGTLVHGEPFQEWHDGVLISWRFRVGGWSDRVEHYLSYEHVVLTDAAPGTWVSNVVWTWQGRSERRGPKESAISTWRKWAKNGRVLRVGPERCAPTPAARTEGGEAT